MEITQRLHAVVSDSGVTAANRRQRQETTVSAAQQDKVSPEYHWLNQAQTQLAQESEVDQLKVANLRQALQQGNFELDVEAMAKAMLQQHGKQDK
ncbi:flagellar biosynthesis anti-sigma factor FlgM [Shewanella algae]|uniref:flagellar biosynthesis anti-sigma factor FlgM n=1 Tax=Shewanella algae TaxID=38313 RepID=UPI00313AB978